jgi:pimeloyl-ACP methyl ester carboxylesterase
LIDFLGHGKSERLNAFLADLWFDEAMQVIELIKMKNYQNSNLIGTSGGALVALNVALECGCLINKIVADSFEGEQALDFISEILEEERRHSKTQKNSRDFWQACHGDDWESIVDNDTRASMEHAINIKKFFHKELSELSVPVMLSASLEDEYAQFVNFEEIYGAMLLKIPNGKLCLFKKGGHPAMLTAREEFAKTAKKFLRS